MADKDKEKKKRSTKYQKTASVSSVLMVIFLSAVFLVETRLAGTKFNLSFAIMVMAASFAIVISTIRYTKDKSKLALNVPVIIFVFLTVLMIIGEWNFPHYLLICFAICGISCMYSSFNSTVIYVIAQNLAIGFFIFRGIPVAGPKMPLLLVLITWVLCIFGDIIMLMLTRSATVTLDKALEHRNSFRDLLASTENYVAMIDERNEIVYASKTLSVLGKTEEPELTQGRPIIDLFPGRTLKIYAGKMLKQKEHYAEDWEFTLNGQKRYFKAASHSLPGNSSGTLISLYDMTHLAERDEIAVMKDSMKIGLFFMDKNFVIQDHYAKYLEEMLSEYFLFGKLFTDVIADSVTPNELESIKDYFGMIFEGSYDQEVLEDINPLTELHYVNKNSGDRKVFQFNFNTVERGHGEIFILVTVYDITTRVELQKRLQEEEAKRQEEMQSVFELIQVEPDVFSDFMDDMEHEFGSIDVILKNESLSAHDALVKVYQAVHAIKSNAVILGLNVFGGKVHNLESKIKKLREQEGEVPFVEMLNLAMDLEKLSTEREGFKEIINKLKSYTSGSGEGKKQSINVLIESLAKTTSKAAEDMQKEVQFIAKDVDPEAIERGPRRIIKEVLMQLIRNSVVHGVESPEDRAAKGKNETGTIKLSIKLVEDKINITMSDDGRGLDYKRIAEKALSKNIIKPADANNKDMLIKAIFAPGFSTAETEGVHAGRGIGLNLVRDRVKEANGIIKLRSETGKGTVFFICVPVEKKPDANQNAPKPAAAAKKQ